MIEGASIICFAHDWSGDPTSKTHIMRILARRNRILWVNSVGMRRPTASARDLRRLAMKFRQSFDGCQEVEPNLFAVTPLVLPLPGVAWVDHLNAAILAAWLRHLCRQHQLHRPILWTFLPNVNWLVGRLGERMVIYHCVDEYAAFSGVHAESLIRMERDLVRRADLVFTSSERLCEERRGLNPHTHFVPHGVDAAHFARARHPSTPVPDDVQDLPRPRVGFFGLIAEWIDLSLIRHVALARPQWSIVLVGKPATDLGPVKEVPNVYLLGQKPYAALPGYCKAFDVGIIPFRINELTLKANPLKLREYLAAGLPVVATDLPEVRRYHHLVRLANRPEAFLQEVETALGECGESMARFRTEVMKSESWEARVEQLSAFITSTARPER